MDTTNDIYLNYHAMTGEITEGLSRMAGYCEALSIDSQATALREGKRKLQAHKFAVGILGEFKRGKSTVINALLGKEVMPADILPCSATMNRVSYDLQPRVQLNMVDGTAKQIAVEELSQYVTKLDDDSIANAALIEEAIVFYPCQFCQNGVDIIDTPGLNDDERMNKITEETVPKLDAVVMVLVPDNPFSMSEAEFVRSKLMCSDIGRLIFLVNKIDTVRPRDRARVVQSIRAKIEKSVLGKTAEVYGPDSEQYRAVQQKMADIRIYPISAQDALDGRTGVYEDASENETLVAESGMPEFEASLGKLLTQERGFLELGTPLGQILRCGNEAKEKIRTYIRAMDTDSQTFTDAQSKLLEQQHRVRQEKAAQRQRLQEKSLESKNSLIQKTGALYQELETAAGGIISAMELPEPNKKLDDTAKQALIERAVQQIDAAVSEKMAIFCERISSEIDEIVGKESVQVTQFLNQSQADIAATFSLFTGEQKGKDHSILVDLGGVALSTFVSSIAGGAVVGYRSAGVKGALLGGGVGTATTLVALELLAGLALPALPLALIASAVGVVASKTICNLVFSKSKNLKELEKLKDMLSQSVQQNFSKMRAERAVETWIEDAVSGQFESLCAAMDSECEAAIANADAMIDQIKLDLARNAAEKEAAKKNYRSLEESIDGLMQTLEPIRQKLLQYNG